MNSHQRRTARRALKNQDFYQELTGNAELLDMFGATRLSIYDIHWLEDEDGTPPGFAFRVVGDEYPGRVFVLPNASLSRSIQREEKRIFADPLGMKAVDMSATSPILSVTVDGTAMAWTQTL